MASDQIAHASAGQAQAKEQAQEQAREQVQERAPEQARPQGRSRGVLSNRDFAKLFLGETISQVGSQVTQFTMPLVAIITLNATAFQVGVLNALKFVPVIVIALVAGVWLDRRQRRPVMIMCALGNALLIGLVPISSVSGFLSMGLLYVVILIVGLITAPIALSVDAVSYLFSAAGLIAVVKREPAPDKPAEQPSIRQSLAEGFRAVYGTKLLRILLGQSATLNVGFGAVSTIFTIYAVRVLGFSPGKLGIALGSLAAGALFGSLFAARVERLLGLPRTLTLAIIGVCASPLLLLVPRDASVISLALAMAGWLGHGFGIGMWNVNTITLRQVLTPMRLLGRMNATYRMVLFGALPVGAMLAGLLGDAVGYWHAMLISVIALTAPVAWLTFSPVFRLKELPAGPEPVSQRMDS